MDALSQHTADSMVSDIRDPYPIFAELRRHQPVMQTEQWGRTYYVLTRYDDVDAVLRDAEGFANHHLDEAMGPVMGRTILAMDGATHTRHRTLVSNAFKPGAIRGYAERLVEPLVDELLGRIEKRGRAELVAEFTSTFPMRVIAGLLGVPIHDLGTFTRWAFDINEFAVAPEKGLAASRALKDYLAPIVADRRGGPRDDLISLLSTAEVDGERLSDEDIFGFCRLLIPAGAETTFRFLGNALHSLLAHPEQYAELCADRRLLDAAMDESLRYECPLLFTSRICTRRTEMRGIEIPDQGLVSCCLGSANRDEEHFPEPDRFDLHRGASDYVSFGVGKHFCLGYHLARLEVSTALNQIMDRLANLRLDPDRESYIVGMTFRSPRELNVVWG